MPKVKPRAKAEAEVQVSSVVQVHVAPPSDRGEGEGRVDSSQQAREAARNEPSNSSARGEGEEQRAFLEGDEGVVSPPGGVHHNGSHHGDDGRAEGESAESIKRQYDGRDRWLIPQHPHPLLQCFDRYGGRGFQCDICRQNGVNCSFSCEECDFDVHVICFDAHNGYSRYISDPQSSFSLLHQIDTARERASEKRKQHAAGNLPAATASPPSAESVSSSLPVASASALPNDDGIELVSVPVTSPAHPSQVPPHLRGGHQFSNGHRNAANANPVRPPHVPPSDISVRNNNNHSAEVTPVLPFNSIENNNQGERSIDQPPRNRRDIALEQCPSCFKLSSDELYRVQAFLGILIAIIWVIEAVNMGTYAAQNAQAQIMKNCEGDLIFTCRPDECKVNCDDTGFFCEHIFCWSLDFIGGSCSISTTGSGVRDTQSGLLDRACNSEWYFNRTEPLGCVELCAGQKRFVRETAAAWLTWRACDVLLYFAPWQLYGFAVFYAPFLFMHDLFTIATLGTPLRNLYAADIAYWCLWGSWCLLCFLGTIFMLDRSNRWARFMYEFGRWATKFIAIIVAAWQLHVSETGFTGCIHNAYAKGWGELGINMILAHIVAALNMLYGLIAICAASARRHDKVDFDWKL